MKPPNVRRVEVLLTDDDEGVDEVAGDTGFDNGTGIASAEYEYFPSNGDKFDDLELNVIKRSPSRALIVDVGYGCSQGLQGATKGGKPTVTRRVVILDNFVVFSIDSWFLL